MEVECAHHSPEVMPECLFALSQSLEGIQRGFLWNMDELGHGDWLDAQTETVYVAEKLEADSVLIPVSRTGKHITLIGCICSDGRCSRPPLIDSPSAHY
jgi:hypothetical protein